MNLPWFPFDVEAWLKDTAPLTIEEEGAYIRLLAHMWTRAKADGECALLDDDKYLARLAKTTVRAWRDIREILVDNPNQVYFHAEDGRITQKRMLLEFEKACARSETARNNVMNRYRDRNDGDLTEGDDGQNSPTGNLPGYNSGSPSTPTPVPTPVGSQATNVPTDVVFMSRDIRTSGHPDIRMPEGLHKSSGGGGGQACHAREAAPPPPPSPSVPHSPASKPDAEPDPSDQWTNREDACVTDKLGRWAERIGLEMDLDHAKAQLVLFRGGIGQIREGETVFNALCNFLLLEYRHQHRARSGTNGAKPEPDRDPPTRPGGAAYRYVA